VVSDGGQLRLTRWDKVKVVLVRLENTAAYMALGFWLGTFIPPARIWFVALAMAVAAAAELMFPNKLARSVSIGRGSDEDDFFMELTRVIPQAFLFFFVGYILARLG
jgi:hypothetical protein